MDNGAMKEVLNELLSHLERLETQNEAILQFLKGEKRVTDKQLAPYLEQAANASNVKWRAARVRIDHLLSPEQPEKEAKLGTRPELHEDSSSAEKRSGSDAKEDRRVKPADEEGKGEKSGDQKQTESSDKDAKKAKSTNSETNGADLSKEEKPVTVETVQARPADRKEDQSEEKSEKPRDTEQVTQLKPDKTESGKEAA